MTGKRTGIPNRHLTYPLAHPTVPFPHSDTPTACQTAPQWFSHEQTSTRAAEKDIAKAKHACASCPIVRDCLKWALANPDMTHVGVWAATTTRERSTLRRRMIQRLGPDWVAVVADRERAREQRRQAARYHPPATRQGALARLEHELIPTRPPAYEPWREPITPARAAANRRVLAQALRKGAAA
ncbi:WhiB family transcriptional regulator [Streptomyces abikoensis]|uniref:WhiB family transcriptional regulator n=1 Tax=Streptomyces abikoensis TaxID=97398 RepID=UPI00367F6E5D